MHGQHSWTLDEEHSREIIKRGLELGVNFFDTAIGYQSGTSEQYVGRALRNFAKRAGACQSIPVKPQSALGKTATQNSNMTRLQSRTA